MIVIVMDSTACMTREEARALRVVCNPMTYMVDGKVYTEHFIDDDDHHEAILAKGKDLKTSQASIDSFYKLFGGLLDTGFEILCLTISSRLSGTYNNACVCARELNDQHIRVVDTHTTAGGMLMMVKEARRMVDAGFHLQQAAEGLLAMREQIKTLFTVRDMAPLRRSGRLGGMRQSVGTILNVRPLLTCKEGLVEFCGTVRGRNEQLKSLVEAVPVTASDIMVHYMQLKEDAAIIAERICGRCKSLVQLRKVGPVLGVHLGADILSVMWREQPVR